MFMPFSQVLEVPETSTYSPMSKSDDLTKRDSLTSQTSNQSKSGANRGFLRPSPSETSFTRTRSLNLPPKVKHSPDCKDNPEKL